MSEGLWMWILGTPKSRRWATPLSPKEIFKLRLERKVAKVSCVPRTELFENHYTLLFRGQLGIILSELNPHVTSYHLFLYLWFCLVLFTHIFQSCLYCLWNLNLLFLNVLNFKIIQSIIQILLKIKFFFTCIWSLMPSLIDICPLQRSFPLSPYEENQNK